MSATRYLFDLEMPPVYLGETMAVIKGQRSDVEFPYEETLTWDAGAAVGLVRVITGSLAPIDDLYRWWRLKGRAMGFPFRMSVRVGNRSRGEFTTLTPDEMKALIAQNQDEMVLRLTEGGE